MDLEDDMTKALDEVPSDLARQLAAEYEILGVLGRGGSSVVYLGRDRLLERRVAIKVIHDSSLGDPETIARFEREAHMLAGLQHPNVVTLYGAKRLEGGALVLVMQNGAWRTLKATIREEGPLPFERVGQVLRDIGEALAYLHRNDVIHRDIKPENIFLDRESGRAMLSDFGIARFGDGHNSVTLQGAVLGTPAYMAPEQIDCAEPTYRSDLYSLGMVGYEMVTGVRPWNGESLYGVIFKQKTERLPALEGERPGIPAQLRLAIERAIEKDPALRWASTEEFLAQLGPAGRAQPVRLPLPEAAAPTRRIESSAALVLAEIARAEVPRQATEWKPSSTVLVAAASLVVLLGGAGAIFAAMDTGSEPPQAFDASNFERTPPAGGFAAPPPPVPELAPLPEIVEEDLLPAPPRAAAEVAPAAPAREGPVAPAGPPPPRAPATGAAAPPTPGAQGELTSAISAPVREAAPPPPVLQPEPPASPQLVEPEPRTVPVVRPTPPPLAPPSPVAAPSSVPVIDEREAAAVVPPVLRDPSELARVLRALPATELRRVQSAGGTVVIAVLVNEAGRVEVASLKTASGVPRLDSALLEAVKLLRFTPATRLGQPQPAWIDLPISLVGGGG
jgi:TonB family protein